MIDFDRKHHMSNGWKDGKSIKSQNICPSLSNLCHVKLNQHQPTPIYPATRKTTKQRAAGNTCVRLDLGSSWLSWLVQIQGWLYISSIYHGISVASTLASTLKEGEVFSKLSNQWFSTLVCLHFMCVSPSSWKPGQLKWSTRQCEKRQQHLRSCCSIQHISSSSLGGLPWSLFFVKL